MEETTAKDGKEIKKAIGQDATVSLFDEFDKNYTLTAITGVVVGSIISSIWFKNATRTTKLTAKAGWAEVKQEEIENMLVITL